MIYYAYFSNKKDYVHVFRVYKIVAGNDEEAIRIAKAYDAKYTRAGDKFELRLDGEKIVNEVIE